MLLVICPEIHTDVHSKYIICQLMDVLFVFVILKLYRVMSHLYAPNVFGLIDETLRLAIHFIMHDIKMVPV